MLSLSIASDDKAIKVDKTSNFVKNDHVKARKAYSDIEQFEQPNVTAYNIVKPFPPDGKQKHSEDEPDSYSQYSRQSSVEDSKSEGKSRRKSSGGKSSSIKNKIQMRKMMKEANKMERPTGTLADGDHDTFEDGNDSVEEKQDSEPIVDDEIKNSNKTLKPQSGMSQLTPETERRMKDWNSRFSNLKHSFDPASDREDEPSRLVFYQLQ